MRPSGGTKPNAQLLAHFSTKAFVAIARITAQSVVKMERDQRMATLRPMRPNQEQQRKRIGATRKPDAPRQGAFRVRFNPRQNRRVQSLTRNRFTDENGLLNEVRHEIPEHFLV